MTPPPPCPVRTRASLGCKASGRKGRRPPSVNGRLTMTGEWYPGMLSVRGSSERARGAISGTAGR